LIVYPGGSMKLFNLSLTTFFIIVFISIFITLFLIPTELLYVPLNIFGVLIFDVLLSGVAYLGILFINLGVHILTFILYWVFNLFIGFIIWAFNLLVLPLNSFSYTFPETTIVGIGAIIPSNYEILSIGSIIPSSYEIVSIGAIIPSNFVLLSQGSIVPTTTITILNSYFITIVPSNPLIPGSPYGFTFPKIEFVLGPYPSSDFTIGPFPSTALTIGPFPSSAITIGPFPTSNLNFPGFTIDPFNITLLTNPISSSWIITNFLGNPLTVSSSIIWIELHGDPNRSLLMMALGI
jgi:hypothetical protein